MGKVGEMLQQEIKGSREFASQNFGLPMGNDWVETVRDVLEDEVVCTHLMVDFLKLMLQQRAIQEKIQQSLPREPGPVEMVRALPEISHDVLEFFYWGVQVGRRLEREEAAALDGMAREGG